MLTIADITKDTMRQAFSAYARDHEAASIRRCWSTWNVLCAFLYTGEQRYLAPYDLAIQQIDPAIQKLAELTVDNPYQETRVPQLQTLAHQKLDELRETISLYQSGRLDEARGRARVAGRDTHEPRRRVRRAPQYRWYVPFSAT